MKPRWGVPRVEEFEPRLVLDAFRWNYMGMQAGLWSNPVNWVQNGAPATRIPGAGDDVVFDGSVTTGDCAITGNDPAACDSLRMINSPGELELFTQSLTIAGGPIPSAITSGKLIVDAGLTLTIAGTSLTWYGGSIGGFGNIEVDTGDAQFVITQGAQELDPKLSVGATGPASVTFQNLNQDFTFGPGAGITVGSNGTVNLNTGSTNIKCSTGSSSTSSVISNAGTFNFNTSATITCDLPFFNTGADATLNVPQGTLEFTNGAAQGGFSISRSAGGINLSSGATLKADANTNINGGVLNAIGTGSAYLKGDLTVQAGTVEFNNGVNSGQYGHLQVSGQVSLIGGSSLLVEVDGDGTSCDELAATGTITLGGSAELAVITNGGPPTNTYDVLWTPTGYSGNFASWSFCGANYTAGWVNDPFAGFDYQLAPAPGGGGGPIGTGNNPQ